MILVAFALVLTMTQCKKNEEINQNETVTITLDAKRNNGSRVDVNTATGTVNFESGDKVYVGSGGKYVGFLTHNGTNFVGNITNPTENQPLQFYFLGNVTPNETLTAGTTEECSVIISDQTEHLPVISCATSYENYVSGVTAYSAFLLNKCALVKFNVTTPSNSPICISGMNNKVTIDFTQNTMTPSIDGEGVIMLPAGSGENVEKWAILLPQEELEEGEEGSVFSYDGNYRGTRPAIPMFFTNGYMVEGIRIMVITDNNVPIGASRGLFTINEEEQVFFSRGNLQYQASTNLWRFAINQYDYIGSANSSISQNNNSGWIDLFGWGTGNNPTNSSTNNSDYNFFTDWGHNPISNGGNTANQWRTLTQSEWSYVFNTRTTTSDIRFAKAQVNNVNGVILLPDDWNIYTYSLSNTNNSSASFDSNVISAAQWTILEYNGAVFFPASGYREGYWVSWLESYGCYWSSTKNNTYGAYFIRFSDNSLHLASNPNGQFYGRSVRLVHDTD